jgi:hypothetical protein
MLVMVKFIGPLIVSLVVIALIAWTIIMKHRGYSGIGGRTVVRCRKGHFFTTLWIPGASLKSIRLGFYRYQYCPVGKHWTLVAPVKPNDLTKNQIKQATKYSDINVP